MSAKLIMPDGEPFPFWDDATEYTRIYHVAGESTAASDDNPGTADRPFRTIGRAAAILEPGQKAIVHGGTYRERVRPARGGESADRMIAYEAAPGEQVVIKGSRIWKTRFVPSEGFAAPAGANAPAIWMGDLDPQWFAGYNPFTVNNFTAEFTSYGMEWSHEEAVQFLLKRGMVFADGQPLKQVLRFRKLAESPGAFWVEDPGLRLHFRLPEDADPKSTLIEVTAQEQVFAPSVRGLGFIRVSGFRIEHAADGVPIPQRAMVSAFRGHHWIIEDCRLSHANSTGLDIGTETWHANREAPGAKAGAHIIRRNIISDCGACGVAGCANNENTLVEDNRVERIGGLAIQRIWETAGMKFHNAPRMLIRRNVFRHIRHASGLWMDYLNRDCRVTRNVFADIESVNGACYFEVGQDRNLIDHNVFWDIRRPAPRKAGDKDRFAPGVNVDTSEKCIVAHNFFGKMAWHAVAVHLMQKARAVNGRVATGRRNRVIGNVFSCPKWMEWGTAADNVSDWNLFNGPGDESIMVDYPEPKALQNLAGWQEFFSQDRSSKAIKIDADFDVETLTLTLRIEGELPEKAQVPEMHEPPQTAGPFELKQGANTFRCSCQDGMDARSLPIAALTPIACERMPDEHAG